MFSSHILQEVEAICDRVIIINKGELVTDDTLNNLRKGTGTQTTVTLETKENLSEEMLACLTGADINKVNNTTWRFETTDPETLKKQLLELALKNNLNIVSLQSKTFNLEDVFRTLTA